MIGREKPVLILVMRINLMQVDWISHNVRCKIVLYCWQAVEEKGKR